MRPDYDLSNLELAQANLWLYLHIDDICAQIAGASGRAIPQPSSGPRLEPRSPRDLSDLGKVMH